MIYAVIMAGGSGTRFWPASRAARPKQLLSLAGDKSMIQATLDRLSGLLPPQRSLIVTNQRLVDTMRAQMPSLPATSIIGEPCKRDTAPCVGLAAVMLLREDADAIMVVMPADHVIQATDRFQDAIRHAVRLVEEKPERKITFGIRPTYPAESFGYIERGGSLGDHERTHAVQQFHEKPNVERAEQYLAAGTFLWNSGIFVWRASTILAELKKHEPEMHGHLVAIGDAIGSSGFEEVFAHEFAAIEGRSIDYAVMEKAQDVVVVEAPFDWDDLGSWQAIARLRGTDGEGNTIVGKHIGIDTTGTIVRGDNDHLIVTVGLEDCIVVHTPDATFVANMSREESVREVVRILEEKGWQEHL